MTLRFIKIGVCGLPFPPPRHRVPCDPAPAWHGCLDCGCTSWPGRRARRCCNGCPCRPAPNGRRSICVLVDGEGRGTIALLPADARPCPRHPSAEQRQSAQSPFRPGPLRSAPLTGPFRSTSAPSRASWRRHSPALAPESSHATWLLPAALALQTSASWSQRPPPWRFPPRCWAAPSPCPGPCRPLRRRFHPHARRGRAH